MIERLILLIAVGIISIFVGGWIGGIIGPAVCSTADCQKAVDLVISFIVAIVLLTRVR